MDTSDYYVYAHQTPDGKVFYVGKGRGIRQYQTGNRSGYWRAIARKHGYVSTLLEEGLDEPSAYAEEIKWIKHYKQLGQCNTNFTDGGDGVRVAKRWWYDKISLALKGRSMPKGKASEFYKDIVSMESLVNLYSEEGMSSVEIGKTCGLAYTTVIVRLREYGITVRHGGRTSVPVVCITDGQRFESINDAAHHYHLYRENIRAVLRGRYKHTGGKVFAYASVGGN